MLSSNQARFFEFVESFTCSDTLMNYFDVEKRQLNIELLDSTIGQLSHGEQLLLKFCANVWLGRKKYDFDLFDAAGTLDAENRALVSDWFCEPFWP